MKGFDFRERSTMTMSMIGHCKEPAPRDTLQGPKTFFPAWSPELDKASISNVTVLAKKK